jgi:hypothetical protein
MALEITSVMGILAIKLAIVTFLFWATMGSAVASPQIQAVNVRMFLQYSGELSPPLNGQMPLWNIVIGERGISEPTSAALVDVVVSGPRNTFGGKHVIRLAVKSERSGKVLERSMGRLGIFGPSAETHVGFWLPSVGCEPLVITASIAGNSKTLVVPFRCGE